jgi:Cys-tRNA(Pro) deacylase
MRGPREMSVEYPITPGVRQLRELGIEFEPHVFDYVEKGGTGHSSEVLGVSEHEVVKTLVFRTAEREGIIVLMHGDMKVSTRELGRLAGLKKVGPASPEDASKLTGYQVGGISPFGLKTKIRIFGEETIRNLAKIYINAGKRGFLVSLDPKSFWEVLSVESVKVGFREGDN